jgi:chromosome segregation ATPase
MTQRGMTPSKPTAEELAAQMTADETLLNSLAAAEGRRLQPEEQELNQLIKDVRVRLQQVERQERELQERESRMAMAAAQLSRQAEDLEKLRVELAAAYTPLKESRGELMKTRTMIRNQEILNVQNTAKMWAKMDPANCARLVVEMFGNDQAEAATKIIHFLPEKSWAAIMDEIQDIGPAVDVIIRQLRVVRETRAS